TSPPVSSDTSRSPLSQTAGTRHFEKVRMPTMKEEPRRDTVTADTSKVPLVSLASTLVRPGQSLDPPPGPGRHVFAPPPPFSWSVPGPPERKSEPTPPSRWSLPVCPYSRSVPP